MIMQQRLRDMGSWLRINEEAIYGTRSWTPAPPTSPGGDLSEISFTRKGPALFAHFREWPEGEVRIDKLNPTGNLTVELLGFDGPVEWRVGDGALFLTPPLMSPAQVPSPYAFVFKIGGAFD